MLLAFLTLFAFAASPDPADLCTRALALRPTDQLQAQARCAIRKSLALPKGPLKSALILDVPLARGDEGILLLHDGKRWFDFGRVAGDRRIDDPGSLDGFSELWSVDVFDARTTRAGVVVMLGMRLERTTREGASAFTLDHHFWFMCRHDGTEPVCFQVRDRSDIRVKGNVPGIAAESWTRSVTVDAAGQIIVGELQGSGALSTIDVLAGTHTFAALADVPLVRRFALTPLVHPDATKDLEIPHLP